MKKIEATKVVNGSTVVLSRRSYTYAMGTDDTLLRRTETDGVAGTLPAYSYDGSNRLTRAQATSGGTEDCQYGYDANSNRTSVTINGVTTTYGFNEANQLTSGAPTTPTYDGAGNETRGPDNRTAAYNAKGQTSSITPPGGTALNFTYADADSPERTTAGIVNFADSHSASPCRTPAGRSPTTCATTTAPWWPNGCPAVPPTTTCSTGSARW